MLATPDYRCPSCGAADQLNCVGNRPYRPGCAWGMTRDAWEAVEDGRALNAGRLTTLVKKAAENPRRHTWGPSRVGHGELQCTYCLITNREAAVIAPMFCLHT